MEVVQNVTQKGSDVMRRSNMIAFQQTIKLTVLRWTRHVANKLGRMKNAYKMLAVKPE
jgi:hypothetical protein